LVMAFALAVVALPARAELQWSDNSFRFWYGTSFAEPANGNAVAKSVLTYTHADGYKLGSNFFNIDALYSNEKDVANNGPTPAPANTTVGAVEFYATYRHTLSLNKVTGSKTFAFGPIRDIGIDAGLDANTKNTAFASRKLMPVVGASVAFNVPGFLNVSLLADKEWNYNGFAKKSAEFDVTPMVAASWGIPVYGPVSFEGFGVLNLPKGNDAAGVPTKTELLVRPRLMFDVGTLWGSRGYQLGVGYSYWLNKFGNDPHPSVGVNAGKTVRGTEESAVFGQVAIHL
jgi:hypothetical protein